MAVAIGRDLQRAVLVAHGVVARDDAVLLGAEDVLERAGKSHEGRAGVRGRAGEAGVVRRPEELLEKAIGLGHGGDPGEAQLLGQALLQGPEHALRAAPGLRRIGRDQLDAEPRPGRPGSGCPCPHRACLGRVPVVQGPILAPVELLSKVGDAGFRRRVRLAFLRP